MQISRLPQAIESLNKRLKEIRLSNAPLRMRPSETSRYTNAIVLLESMTKHPRLVTEARVIEIAGVFHSIESKFGIRTAALSLL